MNSQNQEVWVCDCGVTNSVTTRFWDNVPNHGFLHYTATAHAVITDPKEVAPLLRAIDGYQGGFVAKCALRLAPLLFVRPGELGYAEWAEVNLDEPLWNIPAHKMKIKQAHVVPFANKR